MNEVAVAVAGCGDSRDRERKFCVHNQRLTEKKKVGQSVSVRSGSQSGPETNFSVQIPLVSALPHTATLRDTHMTVD